MKKIKNILSNFINGFCMALADSVPGVSGGTVAFILGFYDDFIISLDNLFRGNLKEKKEALIFLLKLGFGWIIGMAIASVVLSSLFSQKIYEMSSLFIGFIIFAIPVVIKGEIDNFKGKYKNIIFTIIGIILVILIAFLNNLGVSNYDINSLNIGTIIYTFLVGALAISAMILPGISGSTMLLIFGLYIPIINKIKDFIHLDFSSMPILVIFGLGVLTGVICFSNVLRKLLEKRRSVVVYTIIGMMIGSIYAIVLGPTTLDVPKDMLSFGTFNILYFVLGGLIMLALEFLKKILENNKNDVTKK